VTQSKRIKSRTDWSSYGIYCYKLGRKKQKWSVRESNPRHLACEASTLPTELTPHAVRWRIYGTSSVSVVWNNVEKTSTFSLEIIMADVHNINNQNGPAEWFQSLPIVTKYWFGATMVLTLSANFGVIDTRNLIWSWTMIRDRFELWRCLSCFCYAGPFSFGTLLLLCK
jgi:Der1-like family